MYMGEWTVPLLALSGHNNSSRLLALLRASLADKKSMNDEYGTSVRDSTHPLPSPHKAYA